LQSRPFNLETDTTLVIHAVLDGVGIGLAFEETKSQNSQINKKRASPFVGLRVMRADYVSALSETRRSQEAWGERWSIGARVR
jgi:hypothetical protein